MSVMVGILQWPAHYTHQTRPNGEVWPRITKGLSFYASPWPIAAKEARGTRWLEIKSANAWCDRHGFFHFVNLACWNDFYSNTTFYMQLNESFVMKLKTILICDWIKYKISHPRWSAIMCYNGAGAGLQHWIDYGPIQPINKRLAMWWMALNAGKSLNWIEGVSLETNSCESTVNVSCSNHCAPYRSSPFARKGSRARPSYLAWKFLQVETLAWSQHGSLGFITTMLISVWTVSH